MKILLNLLLKVIQCRVNLYQKPMNRKPKSRMKISKKYQESNYDKGTVFDWLKIKLDACE